MATKVLLALPMAFIMILTAIPAASAQASPDLTFTGNDLLDCDTTALALMCWNIEGDPDTAFVAGQEVTIKVVAPGQAPHNLYFIADGAQDTTTYNTDAGEAIAGSDTVSEGEETTFSFIVPPDVTALYYWCDVGLPVADVGGDHELLGMRGTVNVTAAANDTDGDDDTGGDDNDTDGDGTGADDNGADDNSTGNEDDGTADDNTTGDDEASDMDTGADNDTTGDVHRLESRDTPLGLWVGLVALGAVAVGLRRDRR